MTPTARAAARAYLARAAAFAVGAILFGALAYVLAPSLTGADTGAEPDAYTADARPAATDWAARAAELVAENDCWTGEAPADVIPGHAVVTTPGRPPHLAPAARGFAIWLDGAPGTLHAFCK